MEQNEQIKMEDQMSFSLNRPINEQILMKAHMNLKLFGPDGKLKDERNVHNTVSSAAKYGTMDQLLATPNNVGYTAKPGWMELGTGSIGATTLGAYISGSRTVLDSKTRSGAVITMICTFIPTVGTGAITEAGIFDVVTQNTQYLWLGANFAVVTKGAGDTLVITWTLTQS